MQQGDGSKKRRRRISGVLKAVCHESGQLKANLKTWIFKLLNFKLNCFLFCFMIFQ